MNSVICGMTMYQILWYLLIYSFLGWCVEVAYHAMKAHRLVNRGFLNGPACPVYGFGVLLVFAVVFYAMGQTEGYLENVSLFMLFPIGVVMTTAVELLGGYLLDVAFHARWWDYRRERFNFHGYICLKFSILWGLGILLLVKLVHPIVEKSTVSLIPMRIGMWIVGMLCIAYFADFVVSVLITMKLNRELEELDDIQQNMRKVSDQLTRIVAGSSIAAEVLVDAGLTKAGLVKEDTLYAVVDQALNAGDVIDPKTYNEEFKETGIPEQASVQVEQDVKEALRERREAYEDELEQRLDDAIATITEKKEAAEARVDDAIATITEKREEAEDNINLTREALEKRLDELRAQSAAIYSAALRHKVFGPLRLLRAFPRMTHERYSDALENLRSIAGERFDPCDKNK